MKLCSPEVIFVAFNANKNIFNIINHGLLIDDFMLSLSTNILPIFYKDLFAT